VIFLNTLDNMTSLLLIRHSEPFLDDDNPPSKWVLRKRWRDRSKLPGEYLKEHQVDRILVSTEVKVLRPPISQPKSQEYRTCSPIMIFESIIGTTFPSSAQTNIDHWQSNAYVSQIN
jgi:hypothetical protein